MNISKMLHDLYRLKREWKRASIRADVTDGHNCARNISRGIDMAFDVVQAHVKAPRAMRGNTKTPYTDSTERGFTLVELMIVIAIIGILAAIALPQLGAMTRKSKEACTKGNLGTLRSALSIYYAETEGGMPSDDLSSLTIGSKYLTQIPLKSTPPFHPDGHSVSVGNESTMTDSQGDWFYFNETGDSHQGLIVVNCVHTDIRGNPWTSY